MDYDLKKPIAIINRQNGKVVKIVDNRQDYLTLYHQMCQFNDVKMAIKVWCDFTNQTKLELLRDFDLMELINCFSTRYIAQYCNGKRNHVEV